jgi:serine/threonine protein phosphatase PrpC
MALCPQCDTEAGPEDRFCEACGAAIDGAARPADPPTRPTGAERRKNCRCLPDDVNPDGNGYCRTCGFRLPNVPPADEPSLVIAVDAELAALSDRGNRYRKGRWTNQDSAMADRLDDGAAVLAVADGVSSSNGAARASAAAVAALRYVLQSAAENEPPVTAMRRAMAAAHEAVKAVTVANPDPAKDPPETTIAAALVRDGKVTFGWVGDSRVYLIQGERGRLLTRDDSWMAEVLHAGVMTREAAQADRRAHSITQCLGVPDAELVIHVEQAGVRPGSWLLLCTDGLWNYLDDATRLAGVLSELPADTDAITRCQRLVLIANESGGHDNISVAMTRVPTAEARPGAVWRRYHPSPSTRKQ